MSDGQPTSAQLDAWREELVQLCRQKFASALNEFPLDVDRRIRVIAFILKRYDSLPPELTGQVDAGADPFEDIPVDLTESCKPRYNWDNARSEPPAMVETPHHELLPRTLEQMIVADLRLMDSLEADYGRELGEFRFEQVRGYRAPAARFPSELSTWRRRIWNALRFEIMCRIVRIRKDPVDYTASCAVVPRRWRRHHRKQY